MILTYLNHSGFLAEGQQAYLLFDYWPAAVRPAHWPENAEFDADEAAAGVITAAMLDKSKRLYVFISHHHPDHCSREALELGRAHGDTVFIVAKEAKRAACGVDAVLMKKGDAYDDGICAVRAFGSTDVGVSYCVSLEGKEIFHAGDLNDWHWRNDPDITANESRGYTRAFGHELSDIAKSVPRLDLAMLPLDSRLGDGMCDGPEAFLCAIPTAVCAPMHLWGHYEAQEQLIKRCAGRIDTRIVRYGHRGQREEF